MNKIPSCFVSAFFVLACGAPREDAAPIGPSASASSPLTAEQDPTAAVPSDAPVDLPFAKGALAPPLTFDVATSRVQASTLPVSTPSFQAKDVVLSGSIVQGSFRTHEVTYAVFVGGESWVLAQEKTGLWLHEAGSLARRVRLAHGPITGLTASADGSRFAFATASLEQPRFAGPSGVEPQPAKGSANLHVFEFPSLKKLGAFPIPRPKRIRMNRAGDAVAVASQLDEEVALVTLSDKKVRRYDVDDEVNDAVPLDGHEGEVAYVTDADDTFVRDMPKNKQLYSSLGTHGSGYPTRDQNGVAYDPATDALYSSGEDNAVWTYEGWRAGQRRASRSADYAGDVDEIVFARGEVYAALDSIAVFRGHANGSHVGPFGDRTFSDPARVFVGERGSVLMALDGRLARWDGDGPNFAVARDTQGQLYGSLAGKHATYFQFQGKVFAARAGEPEASIGPSTLTAHGASQLRAVVTLGETDVVIASLERSLVCEFISGEAPFARGFDHEGKFLEARANLDGTLVGVLLSTGEVIEIDANGTEQRRTKLESPMSDARWPIQVRPLIATKEGFQLGPTRPHLGQKR